jgi:membrane associated rhomboid family serine protease
MMTAKSRAGREEGINVGVMQVSLFQDTSNDPRRGYPDGPTPDRRPQHEPVFNAPWPAMALVVLIIGGYALQAQLSPSQIDPWVFTPAALKAGEWRTVFTAIFLHGNWTHAITNAAMALAFATPLARYMGDSPRGVFAFFSFYLLCGALGNLGFAAVHLGSPEGIVGASGAVAGLRGAVARLIGGRGRLGGLFSPPVLGMGAALLAVNLLIGILGGAWVPGSGGAGIAWEAHLAGFLAGLLLIEPFALVAGRR